jgi:hypothetical protein
MTKTTSNGAAPHICFERIIPDSLDKERSMRQVLRAQLATKMDGKLKAADHLAIARMAIPLSKKWSTGATLRCRFLDGSAKMRRQVEAYAHDWEKYANLKLKFVASGEAEIRISFYADSGSWSAVGRDALNEQYFPKHQPTMNYGWLRDDTPAREYSRVVIHEFGHALGAIHEHQQPRFNRIWNVKNVMKYFSGPPNYWSTEDIKSNVLEKYSPKNVSATDYDPDSIMLYEFGAILFADGKGATKSNFTESKKDIAKMKELYPRG